MFQFVALLFLWWYFQPDAWVILLLTTAILADALVLTLKRKRKL